ncbi:MAG TPA: TIGR03667 family PPOX class F420-dependent oxidoreductase [Anaerolineales bacterium]|nr:TIGR03667 family PPOX class F420-dependent oxidoreductase [Anaerolineales bacterium]
MIDFTSEFGQTVKRHIDEEYFIWLTTIDSALLPQPRPVWFIWDKDSFLIFSEPKAHKVRHIMKHPNVALHFNTADKKGEQDVIVILGTASIKSNAPPAYKVPAYLKKYKSGITDLDLSSEEMGEKYSVAIRVKPISVRGW